MDKQAGLHHVHSDQQTWAKSLSKPHRLFFCLENSFGYLNPNLFAQFLWLNLIIAHQLSATDCQF